MILCLSFVAFWCPNSRTWFSCAAWPLCLSNPFSIMASLQSATEEKKNILAFAFMDCHYHYVARNYLPTMEVHHIGESNYITIRTHPIRCGMSVHLNNTNPELASHGASNRISIMPRSNSAYIPTSLSCLKTMVDPLSKMTPVNLSLLLSIASFWPDRLDLPLLPLHAIKWDQWFFFFFWGATANLLRRAAIHKKYYTLVYDFCQNKTVSHHHDTPTTSTNRCNLGL